MKFGIITPVFDGCLGSLELLFREINNQSHTDWVWMFCSNGYSQKISDFVQKKNAILKKKQGNSRESGGLEYSFLEYEETPDIFSLVINVGKRRNYCISRTTADYIFLIDADAKLLTSQMFQEVNACLEKSQEDIYLYKVMHSEGYLLPIFPIARGTIDTLNYCVSAKLAKEVGFPTTLVNNQLGNDFWFIKNCLDAVNGKYVFIDRLFGKHNGNNAYINLLVLLDRTRKRKLPAVLVRSLKVKIRRAFKIFIVKYLLNPLNL